MLIHGKHTIFPPITTKNALSDSRRRDRHYSEKQQKIIETITIYGKYGKRAQ